MSKPFASRKPRGREFIPGQRTSTVIDFELRTLSRGSSRLITQRLLVPSDQDIRWDATEKKIKVYDKGTWKSTDALT